MNPKLGQLKNKNEYVAFTYTGESEVPTWKHVVSPTAWLYQKEEPEPGEDHP